MRNRVCLIDGCDGRIDARGWCRKHYQRWRRLGDPLASAPRLACFGHVTVRELCDELQISYRQLDYWIRNGMVAVSTATPGSGSYRTFSADEVSAIRATVHELHDAERRVIDVRSGAFFRKCIDDMERVTT